MRDLCKFEPNKNISTIWKFFSPIIGNNYGTAGLVAGLYLRSGVEPFTGYEHYKGRGNLTWREFALDKKGFGIGKWKSWERKLSLYNYCRKAEEPLYDILSQMSFIMDEFSGTSYGPVLRELTDAVSVRDAAYAVYDRYLDIKKSSDEKRETCADLALAIYDTYGMPNELMVPVKYVKTDRKNVRIKGRKGKYVAFARKFVGTMKPGELYKFARVSDDGKEYALYYNGELNYVNADKTYIVTKMEAVK